MNVAAAWVALAFAVLTGCTPFGVPLDASVPVAVAERQPLPACGGENAGQAGPWNIEARTCFWRAYEDRRPAEFISTRSSA